MLDTSQHMLLTKIGKSEETFIVFLNKKKKKNLAFECTLQK